MYHILSSFSKRSSIEKKDKVIFANEVAEYVWVILSLLKRIRTINMSLNLEGDFLFSK